MVFQVILHQHLLDSGAGTVMVLAECYIESNNSAYLAWSWF